MSSYTLNSENAAEIASKIKDVLAGKTFVVVSSIMHEHADVPQLDVHVDCHLINDDVLSFSSDVGYKGTLITMSDERRVHVFKATDEISVDDNTKVTCHFVAPNGNKRTTIFAVQNI